MQDITIIEDCYPFYVRFIHNEIDQIIALAKQSVDNVKFFSPFTHYKLTEEHVSQLKSICPLYEHFDISENRVSMFVTQPGLYYRAHKDGLNHKFSFNYSIKILDNKCVTSWYDDKSLDHYKIDNLKNNNSRECEGFKKENHTPIKSVVIPANECVLFNTDIFHDLDKRKSTNERMILTFRLKYYSKPNSTFDDARTT